MNKQQQKVLTFLPLLWTGLCLLKVAVQFLILFCFSSWIFEVWVDKMKLLSNLSLTQAIASFLHLAFVFHLQYPQVILMF